MTESRLDCPRSSCVSLLGKRVSRKRIYARSLPWLASTALPFCGRRACSRKTFSLVSRFDGSRWRSLLRLPQCHVVDIGPRGRIALVARGAIRMQDDFRRAPRKPLLLLEGADLIGITIGVRFAADKGSAHIVLPSVESQQLARAGRAASHASVRIAPPLLMRRATAARKAIAAAPQPVSEG